MHPRLLAYLSGALALEDTAQTCLRPSNAALVPVWSATQAGEMTMKQRRDRLLGHFCRPLNENVTRAALIKFCAERSYSWNRAPAAQRIRPW
jgi:hypothetical protein